MKKRNRVMVVLAIALVLAFGTVNLHYLLSSAREKVRVDNNTGSGESMNITLHVGLLPTVYIYVIFDNQ